MRIVNLGKHKFEPGTVVETPGSRANVTAVEFFDLTGRHFSGDWGLLCQEDKDLNDNALKNEERILSKYKLKNGKSIYIITEWDRSVTTLLLPEEY